VLVINSVCEKKTFCARALVGFIT